MNEKHCGMKRGIGDTGLLSARLYPDVEQGGLVLSRDLRVDQFKVLVLTEDDLIQDKSE
jgi:hypothetical protein